MSIVLFFYFLALKVCWKRKLVSICEDPVSGLMSVMSDYDRLLCDSPVLPYLHRLSVCGLFIRRILLGFEKLSFTEVSNFAAIFKQYCCDGLTILLEYQPEISSQSELSALVEFTQEMNKSIGKILTGKSLWQALILHQLTHVTNWITSSVHENWKLSTWGEHVFFLHRLVFVLTFRTT